MIRYLMMKMSTIVLPFYQQQAKPKVKDRAARKSADKHPLPNSTRQISCLSLSGRLTDFILYYINFLGEQSESRLLWLPISSSKAVHEYLSIDQQSKWMPTSWLLNSVSSLYILPTLFPAPPFQTWLDAGGCWCCWGWRPSIVPCACDNALATRSSTPAEAAAWAKRGFPVEWDCRCMSSCSSSV